jgi:hypothetical protein
MVGQKRAPVAKLAESGFDITSQANELKLATSSKYTLYLSSIENYADL